MLGNSGKGLTEYYGARFKSAYILNCIAICLYGYLLQVEKLDIITATMGHALATEGGFCTGNARVIEHQVWNHPQEWKLKIGFFY